MPTTCTFHLDRINAIYNSGEYVHGRIVLQTQKPKRVTAVYVTLEGEAKVQWSIGGKSDTSHYYGHQQYLYTRASVYDNDSHFRAGTHIYMLRLRIPSGCPTSCKGPYGFIAYSITLTIGKPWTFDEIFRKPITVVQTLNLNHNPEYALPIRDENIKYLCQWPCSSGPICYTLLLSSSGFVPRQQIQFMLEVDNQSPHYDIARVEATLKQHFIFLARKPFKRNYFTKTLAKAVITDPTLRLTKRMYEGSVCVPSETPRSTLNPNYIVFLHYTLQVKLKTGYFHYDTDLSVPVVIGTVPLQHRNPRDATIVTTTQPQLRNRNMYPLTEEDDGSGTAGEQWSVEAEINQSREYDDDEDVSEHEAAGAAGSGNGHMSGTANGGRRRMSRECNNNNNDNDNEDNDDPPSYDSCLPPSFSFATLSSQQTLDSIDKTVHNAKQGAISIRLPKFPDYSTFTTSTQAINNSEDSALNMSYHHSYGSLFTGAETGRSLDTFQTSCGTLSESDEHVDEQDPDDDDYDDLFSLQ